MLDASCSPTSSSKHRVTSFYRAHSLLSPFLFLYRYKYKSLHTLRSVKTSLELAYTEARKHEFAESAFRRGKTTSQSAQVVCYQRSRPAAPVPPVHFGDRPLDHGLH